MAKHEKAEMFVSRLVDASPEAVFQAWTEPKQVAIWWGPEGFSNPVCEVDARPGGKMRIHMKAPDGVEYPMTGTFKEVAAPERLVFASEALDKDGRVIFEDLNTVTFKPEGGKTRMEIHSVVEDVTDEAKQYTDGMEEGWAQSLVRLDRMLAKN